MAQWINFSRSSSSLSFFITIIISVIIIRITEIFIYIKSSFSIPGDIMNSHPATYYHYEPLLHYDIKQARYDYHHHCHHHHDDWWQVWRIGSRRCASPHRSHALQLHKSRKVFFLFLLLLLLLLMLLLMLLLLLFVPLFTVIDTFQLFGIWSASPLAIPTQRKALEALYGGWVEKVRRNHHLKSTWYLFVS